MGETPATSDLNTGPTLWSYTEVMDEVKHMEETQKDVLKTISVLVSKFQKLKYPFKIPLTTC